MDATFLQVLSIALSAAASLIGSLVLWNLRALGKRLDSHENRLNSLEAQRITCQQDFVSSETFLRETGFARRTLERQTASLSRMEGQLTITEKLPAIVGEISRNIVAEMKKG